MSYYRPVKSTDTFGDRIDVEDFTPVNLSYDAEKLLERIFFEGALPVDALAIFPVHELVAQRCAGFEDFMVFLTEIGNRHYLRHGGKHKKNTWLENKKLVRERELKELYAVLGWCPEE